MICSTETRTNVIQLAGALRSAPTDHFAAHLYTCTYATANGPLVLSVMDSADVPAASTYFTANRARLGANHRLDGMTGLGLPAYETTNGVVTFLKDHMTLVVDARGLRGSIGPQKHTPSDLAYTVATDVLACWNGD